MKLKYNKSLIEYDITEEDFENSKRIVKSGNIYGKIISKDETHNTYLLGFCDGGCVIVNEAELHLFEVL